MVEDADYLLKPRSDGNQHLHRFLTIADGVVRSQGRKIIFSTNLPNVGDLDEALIRPGRCYARAYVRTLTAEEAAKLAVRVAAGDPEKLQRVAEAFPPDSRGHSGLRFSGRWLEGSIGLGGASPGPLDLRLQAPRQ